MLSNQSGIFCVHVNEVVIGVLGVLSERGGLVGRAVEQGVGTGTAHVIILILSRALGVAVFVVVDNEEVVQLEGDVVKILALQLINIAPLLHDAGEGDDFIPGSRDRVRSNEFDLVGGRLL